MTDLTWSDLLAFCERYDHAAVYEMRDGRQHVERRRTRAPRVKLDLARRTRYTPTTSGPCAPVHRHSLHRVLGTTTRSITPSAAHDATLHERRAARDSGHPPMTGTLAASARGEARPHNPV